MGVFAEESHSPVSWRRFRHAVCLSLSDVRCDGWWVSKRKQEGGTRCDGQNLLLRILKEVCLSPPFTSIRAYSPIMSS